MLKKLLFFSFLSVSTLTFAQNEFPNDTIRRQQPATIKEFGGFLLDMSLMKVRPAQLPSLNLDTPNLTKDYSRLFSLKNEPVYSQGFVADATGWNHSWSSPTSQWMQTATFQLNNGLQLNLMGEYDKDGRKVRRHLPAEPWKRNNFKGAFELKSANGNFGIRLELQRGY